LRHDRPTTELQAKFSLPYTVASGLLDGELTLGSFTDAALARPAARALMELVSVREDVACRPEDPDGRHSSASSGGFVDVVVRGRDGREARGRVADIAGSPARPLTRQEQHAKFIDCLRTGGRDPALAGEVMTRLRELDRIDDVEQALSVLTLTTDAEEHR
jgi:2-methylcitrate dehydratase PrpD